MAKSKHEKRSTPKSRRKGLGDLPEPHRRKGGTALYDAQEAAESALRALGCGRCAVAHGHLLAAERRFGAGMAHAESAGKPLRVDPVPEQTLKSAKAKFTRACTVEWSGRETPD